MKVLLISLPLNTSYAAAVYPMGLGYIGAILKRLDCEIDVLDIRLNNYEKSYISDYLRKRCAEYQLIGISGMITTYRYAKWLSQEIRKYNPKAVICVGGSISTAGKLLFQDSGVDIVCRGEGEKVITDIVEAIRGNTGMESVPNIFVRKGGEVVTTKTEQPMDINLIPSPAWELFDMKRYTTTPYIVPISTPRITMIIERGCPFECTFCYRNFGRIIRYRNVDKIIEEIKSAKELFNIGHIDFLDEIFNTNTKQVKELCGRIIKEDLNITWRCIGRTDLVDRETLQLMREAGCKWIGYGIESGSQEMLDKMNKKQKIADIEESIRNSREAGLIVTGTFIMGMPGENERTIQETKDFFRRNNMYNLPFFPVPYPGTILYDESKKRGLIKNEEEFIMSLEKDATELIINLTDMPDLELIRLRENLKEEFSQLFPL